MESIFYITNNIYKYKIAVNTLKNIGLNKKIKLERLTVWNNNQWIKLNNFLNKCEKIN